MIFDILGFSMEALGAPWGPHGDSMGSHGNPWEPTGAHGNPWEPMGTHGNQLAGTQGSLRDRMGGRAHREPKGPFLCIWIAWPVFYILLSR